MAVYNAPKLPGRYGTIPLLIGRPPWPQQQQPFLQLPKLTTVHSPSQYGFASWRPVPEAAVSVARPWLLQIPAILLPVSSICLASHGCLTVVQLQRLQQALASSAVLCATVLAGGIELSERRRRLRQDLSLLPVLLVNPTESFSASLAYCSSKA